MLTQKVVKREIQNNIRVLWELVRNRKCLAYSRLMERQTPELETVSLFYSASR